MRTQECDFKAAARWIAAFSGAWLACLVFLPGTAGATAALLDGANFREAAGMSVRSPAAVERFFRERGNQPAWTTDDGGPLQELRRAINDATSHGLSPADYHVEALSRVAAATDRVAVEILATDAYLTFGAHLLRGKLDPVSVEPHWTAARRSTELIAHLGDALAGGRVSDSLSALAPNVRSYRILRGALSEFEEAAASGGWPTIPDGPTLKVGMQGPRVAALRKRLMAGNLLQQPRGSQEDVFDVPVEVAVGTFQRKIGLEADGVVGPLTLRELNRSAAQRAAQIRANLERWRWLAEDLGARHIRVNIAEFRLETWSGGRQVEVHNVIVGRSYRKTPVFSGAISFLVLNPWWETPRNIARLDKLPAFKAAPDSVQRLGFEVLDTSGRQLDPSTVNWHQYSAYDFPFRLRQRPGPNNALGQVKLMFPNRHNVYLHDTPVRELFNRTRRDFSSGCIRVHRALDLTEWVLEETPGWRRNRIETIVASGREQRINLVSPVAVHILYLTAVTTANDSVRFVPDIYDRDARLVVALGKDHTGN